MASPSDSNSQRLWLYRIRNLARWRGCWRHCPAAVALVDAEVVFVTPGIWPICPVSGGMGGVMILQNTAATVGDIEKP